MARWSIAVFVLVVATSARAGGIVWHAPSGCPDDAAVRQAIEHRLEGSLDAVALAVDVAIARGDAGFVAQIRVAGTDDRTLTSTSCTELTEAIAVVVARLATEARDASPPPPAPPPAPSPRVEVVAAPPRPIAAPTPWNAGLRTTAILGSGNVPDVGVAGELAAWVAWRRLFVELAGVRWLSARAKLDEVTMAGTDVQLDAIALRAGWQFRVLRAWLVGEVGGLHGTGVGLMAPRSGTGTWLAAGAGVGAVWPLAAHVRGVVGAELEITMNRVEFALDSGQVLYRSSPLAVRGGLGIELVWH